MERFVRVPACFNFLYLPDPAWPFFHSLERELGSTTSNDFKFVYSLRPRQHVQVHSLAWADLWPDEITHRSFFYHSCLLALVSHSQTLGLAM